MIGKKINQLATELAPVSTDLTIIGDPISGVSKKITLAQLGAIFSGAVSFYTNLAGFPATGDINVIYCAKDTQKLYLWSGSSYVEVFPSQALLNTYQLRSEKGVSNGYASLDSTGKVPISQLPSSIMEYKGTWNAATNTPTLANGTGDTGDVYICNVAGTVNFGAGPITFAVGDYVIYSGTIWQRSSGAVGTVTSVAVSRSGDALAITGSPITTSGTINLGFAGNSTQYINGAGNLVTFPGIINEAQNLITEVYNKTGATLTKGTVVYINGGQGNLPAVTKALATGDSTSAQTYGIVRNDITNNNNGYVVVAGRISDLDTQAYTEGTQLYLSPTTAGTFTSTKPYAPQHLVYVGIVVRAHPTQGVIEVKIQNGYEMDELHNVSAQNPDNNDILQYKTSTGLWTKVAGTTSNIAEGSNLYYTDARSRAALSFTAGSGAYNSTTGVITIPTNTNQLTNGANYITLGSLSASSPLSYNNTTGAFSISQANSTTNGFLSSADWTTFNNKQNALSGTGFVKISGTTISYDNSTYLTTSAAASTYLPLVLNGSANTVDINGQQFTIQGSAGGFTSGRIIVDPVFSAIGYQNSGVFDGLKILTNGNAEFTNSGVTRFFNQVRFDSTLTNGTYTYTLPSATGTIALVGGAGVGTVTSVGLSSATSGVTIGSTPITTSGTITLAIATASGSQQGLLSSTDWTTFNNKQNALTNPVTGTGTTNYLPKFTGTSTIGNSLLTDDGTTLSYGNNIVTIGASNTSEKYLQINSSTGILYLGGTSGEHYIYGAGNKPINFYTNGTSKMLLTASGNLGLGVTPSAWVSGVGRTALQVGITSVSTNAANDSFYGTNYYDDGSNNRYINSDFSLIYAQQNGNHIWYNAPSGTAGNAISFTQAMTLDASGRLGIGNTNMSSFDANANQLVVGTGTTNQGITIYASTSTESSLYFADGTGASSYRGYIFYSHAQDLMAIGTNGSRAITILNSNNVGIGTTSPGAKLTVSGPDDGTLQIRMLGTAAPTYYWEIGREAMSTGDFRINESFAGSVSNKLTIKSSGGNVGIGTTSPSQRLQVVGTIAAQVNVDGSDATGIRIYGSGTNKRVDFVAADGNVNERISGIGTGGVGTMTFAVNNDVGVLTERMRITSGGNLLLGTTTSSASYRMDIAGPQGAIWARCNSAGDAQFLSQSSTIGFHYYAYNGSSPQFYVLTNGDVRNANNSYGAISDISIKENIVDATPKLNDLLKVKIRNYNLIADKNKEKQIGVIAQELEEIFPNMISNDKQLGTDKTIKTVKYSVFVPMLIKAVQELKAELDTLKNK